MSAAADPRVGRLIANGRYRVVGVMGDVGTGTVYRGTQRVGDQTRLVAIKAPRSDGAEDPSIAPRFQREAGIVSMLEHINTIRCWDAGRLDDGEPFLVMEFVPGESLATVIARGALAPSRVASIVAQVGGALDEVHANGVVHRDLNPSGVALMPKGDRADFVKVLDFSFAKHSDASDPAQPRLSLPGLVLGTPAYMSPEQFTAQPLGPASDIYALAVIAYEMLTGRLPFKATTPWEYAVAHLQHAPTPFEAHPVGLQVPVRQKNAVMRALAKQPAERHPTVEEFLHEFGG